MVPMWEGNASATPDSRARSASFDTTSVRCQTAMAKGTAWMGAANVPRDIPVNFVRQVRFFHYVVRIQSTVSSNTLYFKTTFSSCLRSMEDINQKHNKLIQVLTLHLAITAAPQNYPSPSNHYICSSAQWTVRTRSAQATGGV